MKKISIIFLQFFFYVSSSFAQSIPGIQSVSSFEEKNTKRNDLNRFISQLETELGQTYVADTNFILNNIEYNKDQIAMTQAKLRDTNTLKNNNDTTTPYLHKSLDFYQQSLKRSENELILARINQTKLTDLKKQLVDKKEELNKTENEINVMLMPKIAQQNFMFYSSIAFVLLMSILLGTFYYVVKSDDQIRRTIFGSESGIQFIALFSIIIAIILLGLTSVLEGKELSALLGSVAGYILGKSKFAGV